MTFEEMKKVVYADKPEFGKIIEAHGDETLFSYWQKNYITPKREYLDRQTELTQVLGDIATDRLGARGRTFVEEYLKVNSFVSTTDHHHLLCHPFFVNQHLVQSLIHKKQNISTILVLGVSGISPDNSSFPRGLFYHDEQLQKQRIPLFTLKYRRLPVYALPAYTKADVGEENIGRIIDHIYFKKEILERLKYREQTTIANYFAWKQIPGQEQTNLVYIDQETVIVKLLEKLLATDTIIKKILTTPTGLDAFETHFANIVGSFNATKHTGTFLFWAIHNNKREQLIRNGDMLMTKDGSVQIPLAPLDLIQALQEEKIYPSMALSLPILSFYYGLTLGGGFSQVEYLSQMKRAYTNVLQDIGEADEIKKFQSIETNHFSGEVVIATIARKQKRVRATLLDLMLYKNQNTKNRIEKHVHALTLRKAILPMIPEYYKIITGHWPDTIPRFQLPTPICRVKEKPQCIYCGNAQTNHTIEWINQTISVVRSPFGNRLIQSWLGRFAAWLAIHLELQLFYFFKFLRLAKFVDGDAVRPVTERSKLIYNEGIRRGFKISQVVMLGRPTEFFITQIKNKTVLYESIPRPRHLESYSIFWMDDKLLLKEALGKASIPVSKGGSFSSWFMIRRVFKDMQKPVIIKPRLGSRGRHTTTHIYTERELRVAVDIAKQLCHYVIMEEHLKGSVYRATAIGGKVVGILAGDQPKIRGDGVSTIVELIEQKNKTKPDRVRDVIVDDKVIDFIARMGYTLETILPKNITIELSEKIGLAYGGSAREISPITHPKIIKTIERAAKAVDDPVIGFDFIIEDPTQDPDIQKWGIIEANSLPFINLHYEPLEGPSIDVAPYIWDLWNLEVRN